MIQLLHTFDRKFKFLYFPFKTLFSVCPIQRSTQLGQTVIEMGSLDNTAR
jgi:hypothetical protein